MREKMSLSLLFFTICWPMTIRAHGPVHELILEYSQKIEDDPHNASLYLKRGEYYRIDENYDAAYLDFMKALELDSSLVVETDFQLGHLFAEQGAALSGLFHIQRFLEQHPQHVKALIMQAGLYQQLGKDALCVESFSTALKYAKQARPFHYLEIAKASLRADSTNFEQAVYWLEEGEKALGFNIVLRSYAIELDQKSGNYTAALAKIEDIIRRLPRTEKWLLEKARVLESAGLYSEALVVYQETLEAIEQLPRRNRATRMVMEWEAEALQALNRLENP